MILTLTLLLAAAADAVEEEVLPIVVDVVVTAMLTSDSFDLFLLMVRKDLNPMILMDDGRWRWSMNRALMMMAMMMMIVEERVRHRQVRKDS